jgi:D-serine deaminase-like pyridoxal phosphate-dependent protein
MSVNPFAWIKTPTLLLNEERCRANIRFMVHKAEANHTDFRPHFKTHQSARVGEWFRECGVRSITVSSVAMASYFANCGWNDITIAFPVNLRQMEEIDSLAARIRLNLLVESPETVDALIHRLHHPVGTWIKVDVGANRTGIPLADTEKIIHLAKAIDQGGLLEFCGVLTHAGQFYHFSPQEIRRQYALIYGQLDLLRSSLRRAGCTRAEISYGDTPACTLVEDLSGLDEIRPGNFVFYDAMQYMLGVCPEDKIAVGLACPVVARHPDRNLLIVYGGAIHLSKDDMIYRGQRNFGLAALPDVNGWGPILPDAAVVGLSQEHGMLRVDADTMEKVKVGDLVVILPVHSCLTVDLMQRYYLPDGQVIDTLGKGYL